MSQNAVVQKYSKALFDVTYEAGKAGLCAQELAEIAKAFSEDVVQYFKNPFNPAETKLSIVKAAIEGKSTIEIFNFLCTLVENERIYLVAEISKEFSTMVQAAAGITKGKFFSAIDVSPEFLNQVEQQASKTLGKKVELVFEKDENLLAGYKVQVGGWTMDDSAAIHLKILKDELMKKGL